MWNLHCFCIQRQSISALSTSVKQALAVVWLGLQLLCYICHSDTIQYWNSLASTVRWSKTVRATTSKQSLDVYSVSVRSWLSQAGVLRAIRSQPRLLFNNCIGIKGIVGEFVVLRCVRGRWWISFFLLLSRTSKLYDMFRSFRSTRLKPRAVTTSTNKYVLWQAGIGSSTVSGETVLNGAGTVAITTIELHSLDSSYSESSTIHCAKSSKTS